MCLEGENACPPEDCGGPGGYAELLRVLADPAHDDHEDLLRWVGGPFEPTRFDLAEVNAALATPALSLAPAHRSGDEVSASR